MKTAYEIYPVGYVRRKEDKVYLEITERFRDMTQFDPPFQAPRLGIFASRAPMRPNPIALSTVKVKT